MAFTLRLDDETEQKLAAIAAQDHQSKQAVIGLLVEQEAARRDKSARTRAAFDRVLIRDAELLDRLSR